MGTAHRQKRHKVTWNATAIATSHASSGALRPLVGAVGEVPGCSVIPRSTVLKSLSEWKRLRVTECRPRRPQDA
jgi:hypothetical protein